MRTPGTHGIEWRTLAEWVASFRVLCARHHHPRASTYRAMEAHWDALEAQGPDYFALAEPAALREVQRILREGSGLPGQHGRMRGRARLKDLVNNALAKLDGTHGPGRPKITPLFCRACGHGIPPHVAGGCQRCGSAEVRP